MTTKRKYKCPYCDYREESEKLIRHVAKKHEDLIPEGYTPTRVVYNVRNKREHGSCMMCKKETGWDEATGRYKPFCSQKCHEAYVKRFENNMLRVRGKMRLLDEPEQQEKMLANRRISGKYKFKDGGVHTYTGSYERKALEFLDLVMNVDSKDIMTPGPTLEYEYNGKKHTWITDIFWISLNLIIEIKDGGDNPNKRTMTTYREKQVAKEKMITDKGTFHYLRLTNNNFEQLFNIVAEIKMNAMEDKDEAISRIYEAAEVSEVGPVGGMPPAHTSGGYLIDKGFNGINPIKDDDNYYADGDTIASKKKKDDTIEESVLANDIISDKVVRLNENGIPESVDRSYLEGSDLTIYKFLGDKKKFLEVASSKKPINDFYEALTGKTRYTENQIDLDPLFERVNLRKKINKIGEDLATIRQEAAVRYNKALPYLPVMKIKDMESAEKLLAKYKTLNIAEDVDGYFMYNMITGRRTASVKNINQLVVEDTCLLENEKEIVDTDEALADREANDFKNTNSDAFIDDNVKTKAELDQEYDNYLSMTQDDRKRADDKSIELYGKDNVARYREKNAEFLKQDIKPKSTEVYTGIRNESYYVDYDKDRKINIRYFIYPVWDHQKAFSFVKQKLDAFIRENKIEYYNKPAPNFIKRLINKPSEDEELTYYADKRAKESADKFHSHNDFSENSEAIVGFFTKGNTAKLKKFAKQIEDEMLDKQAKEIEAKNTFGAYSAGQYEVRVESKNKLDAIILIHYPNKVKSSGKLRWYFKEDTYNFDAVNYSQDQVEDAKYWAANAMRVIITPQKTLEDLEFLWNQFQQQHRKLQRESDWKSQELFGMDNRTHYIYLKRQFLPKDIDDDPTETYDGTDDSIIEENMMVRNYNSFKNGDLNILLVTGDNKNSILARRIAHECNAEYIEDSKNLIDICKNAIKNNRRIVVENSNVATLYNHNINWFDNTALIYVKDDKINESVNEKSHDQNKYDALINAYKGYLEYYKNENKKANDVLRSPIHTHTNKLLNGTFSNENDYEIYTDMPAFTVVDFDNFYGEFPGEISSWYNEYKKFSKSGIMTERFRKLNKERITKLSKLMNENNVNDKDILLLGWIPGIPFNEINRSKVDKNISKWIQENSKKEKSLQEKTIGIRFNKKGDLLWVKDPAEIDYAGAWKESHELLKEYDKSKNYEGMKYELARMWFISNNILAQRGSSKYFKSKQMKDTRALAMNDFKKYLKVVIEHEKDFNFTQYYDDSGFKQNTIRVPGATLDYSFDYLKKLLKIFA